MMSLDRLIEHLENLYAGFRRQHPEASEAELDAMVNAEVNRAAAERHERIVNAPEWI